MMDRFVRTAGWVAVYALLAASRVTAQQPAQQAVPVPDLSGLRDSLPLETWLDSIPLHSIPDSIRQRRMVHISPHLVVFSPEHRTATLEFSNQGPFSAEADVQVHLVGLVDRDVLDQQPGDPFALARRSCWV